jgi:hypothetical protein
MGRCTRPLRLLVGMAVAVTACAPATPTAPATATGVPTVGPLISLGDTPSTASPPPTDAPTDLPDWRWTQASLDDPDKVRSITAVWTLPKAFVAMDARDPDVPSASTFQRSADGLRWTIVKFPERGFVYEQGLVRDGVLTIIGRVGPSADPHREIWTTTDGRSWDRLKGTSGLDFGPGWIRDLVHGDAGWLALGIERLDPENQASHFMFSPDGRAWTELESVPDRQRSLASDGRRFVSVGAMFDDDPRLVDVLVSDDARHWSTVHVGELEKWEGASVIAGSASGFAIGGQRFESADESSHPVGWASPDGVSWTASRFDDLVGPAGEAAPRVILASTDGLIAHGNGDPLADALWLSDTGEVWVQVTPLPELDQVDAYARAGSEVIVAGPATGDRHLEIWRGSQVP